VSAIVKRPASTKSKSSKMLQVGIKGTGQLRRHPRSLKEGLLCHFLLCLEGVGKRDFLADPPCAATNIAATSLATTDFIIILLRLL
jgi:hypothetical protein